MSVTTVPATLTGSYAIDPTHSRIGFVARHAMVTKVRGSFNDFAGAGYFDVEDPTKSNLTLTIQAASIDTRNADRDGHLKGNDFFDMATYPTIEFVSTSVEALDEEHYRVTGDLTIKGVTKPVTVDFEYTGTAVDPYNNTRIGLEGKTVINWNATLEAGGVLVSEKVTLEFEVSAVRTDS
jgi:polyisoprenoid-binding protein YceI